MEGQVFVVGLGGASGTGKSTVARRVAERLGGHAMSMETYSCSDDCLPLEQRAKLNYDEPCVIDVRLLDSDIRRYKTGHAIEAPVYDFAQHLRVSDRREHIPAKALLIVEGILALHFAELRPHYDLRIYLEAEQEVCYRRRQVRDITERQRTLELIRWQYESTVLPAERRYVVPSKRYADVVVDSGAELATVEQRLYDAIVQKHAQAAGK